jgi:hypothetical protein
MKMKTKGYKKGGAPMGMKTKGYAKGGATKKTSGAAKGCCHHEDQGRCNHEDQGLR